MIFDRIILSSSRPTLFKNFQNYLADYDIKIFNGSSITSFPTILAIPGKAEDKNWGIYNRISKEKNLTINEKKLISDKKIADAVRRNRCLIPCNAISIVFDKQRYLVHSKKHRLMALGGIVENNTFSILTKKPSTFFKYLNQTEEPLLLHNLQFEQWFNVGQPAWAFSDFSDQLEFTCTRISNDINDTSKNDRNMLKPLIEDQIDGHAIPRKMQYSKSTTTLEERAAYIKDESKKGNL